MPKKKTALTIEERLQQALVPAEEQPYEVPENWVWVRLGSLLKEIKNGTTIKQDKSGNGFSVTRIESLQNQTIDLMRVGTILETEKIKETDWYKSGDITLSHINSIEHVGKTALITDAMLPLVHGMNLLRLRFFEIYTPDLFQLYSQTYQYKNEIRSRINMAVNQVSINQKQLSSLEIPLPPLSEQQRIVERIEELFAKLNEAKERLQEVADSFAVRKAAILHKAFTGELTKKHEIEDSIVIRDKLFAERENMVQEKVLKRVKIKPLIQDEYKSQLAKNWVQCKLGEVAFVTKLAGFEYTKYIHLEDTGEIPVVRAQNVRKGYLDTTNLLYISKSVSDALSRSALKEKSVLITFIGAGIGDACVFDENQQYHLAPNVAKVEPFNKSEEKLNVYFLLYYLLSSFGQYEIFKNMKATAQPSLSMETIREIIIPLPSIEEQHEIVRLIDDLLARERSAQQATEQALASIDLMKKSILARAFRGELGTNRASEASALELLRQVLAEG